MMEDRFTKFETREILSLSIKILSFGMKKLQNLEFWHEKTQDLVNLEFGGNISLSSTSILLSRSTRS